MYELTLELLGYYPYIEAELPQRVHVQIVVEAITSVLDYTRACTTSVVVTLIHTVHTYTSTLQTHRARNNCSSVDCLFTLNNLHVCSTLNNLMLLTR